jgi:hypothetical protein
VLQRSVDSCDVRTVPPAAEDPIPGRPARAQGEQNEPRRVRLPRSWARPSRASSPAPCSRRTRGAGSSVRYLVGT